MNVQSKATLEKAKNKLAKQAERRLEVLKKKHKSAKLHLEREPGNAMLKECLEEVEFEISELEGQVNAVSNS